jgi:hypothetical protein
MLRAPTPAAPLVIACIDERIVAFDRRTGAHAWVFDAGTSIHRIVVSADRVYAGGSDRVVCLEYPTGALVWSVASPVASGTFLVDGDEIFVASMGEIAAFSKVDGRLLWRDPLTGWGNHGMGLATADNAAQYDSR